MKHGVCWYHTESVWRKFKEICVDKEEFGPSHAEWTKAAEKKVAQLAEKGIHLTKIYADPNEFAEWVKINSATPNQQARIRYAAEKILQIGKS